MQLLTVAEMTLLLLNNVSDISLSFGGAFSPAETFTDLYHIFK